MDRQAHPAAGSSPLLSLSPSCFVRETFQTHRKVDMNSPVNPPHPSLGSLIVRRVLVLFLSLLFSLTGFPSRAVTGDAAGTMALPPQEQGLSPRVTITLKNVNADSACPFVSAHIQLSRWSPNSA